MPDKFYFGYEEQDLLLACLCRHPQKFSVAGPLIRPEYMWGLDSTRLMAYLQEYHAEYDHYPTFQGLSVFIQKSCGKEKEDLFNDCADYIDKLRKVTTRDVDFMASATVQFCRERALIAAITKGADLIKAGEIPAEGLGPMMDAARAVGEDVNNLGICYEDDIRTVVKKLTDKSWGVKTGYGLLDAQWRNGWGPGWLIVPLAPPKSYKCESPDTEILMFDGTPKKICTLVPGDRIMGDDSTPRTVLSCGEGYDQMYEVTQANGDAYTVTRDHVLCLKRLQSTVPIGRFKDRYHLGQVLEITAEEYAEKSKWFQRTWKGYKVGVEFPDRSVLIDPYFLGLWLGDGNSDRPAISVGDGDPEIAYFLRDFAPKHDLGLTCQRRKGCTLMRLVREKGQKRNPLTSKMRVLNVLNNKHVPFVYKTNSRKKRLQLLAGLIDSDGHFEKNDGFIFTNTNKRLSDDVCWLARSLGFKSFTAAFKSQCVVKGKKLIATAYSTRIQGKLSEIPTKIARKHGTDSLKASERTTLAIKPVGYKRWFGIEIDGNRRYLHSDFTVTHNSTFIMNLALNMTTKRVNYDTIPVFYYACEISAELSCARGYCMQSGQKFDEMYSHTDRFIATTKEAMEKDFDGPDAGQLLVKTFPSKSARICDIRLHAKMAREAFGLNPGAIFIDHAETVMPGDRVKGSSDHRQQADIYTEARALGEEFQCPVIMPDRCNKETVQHAVPSMTSFQGAFQKAGEVDVAIGLCQTPEERLQNQIRYFIFLNRHGKPFGYFGGSIDDSTFKMSLNTPLDFEDEIQSAKDAEAARGNRKGGQGRGSLFGKADEK